MQPALVKLVHHPPCPYPLALPPSCPGPYLCLFALPLPRALVSAPAVPPAPVPVPAPALFPTFVLPLPQPFDLDPETPDAWSLVKGRPEHGLVRAESKFGRGWFCGGGSASQISGRVCVDACVDAVVYICTCARASVCVCVYVGESPFPLFIM